MLVGLCAARARARARRHQHQQQHQHLLGGPCTAQHQHQDQQENLRAVAAWIQKVHAPPSRALPLSPCILLNKIQGCPSETLKICESVKLFWYQQKLMMTVEFDTDNTTTISHILVPQSRFQTATKIINISCQKKFFLILKTPIKHLWRNKTQVFLGQITSEKQRCFWC